MGRKFAQSRRTRSGDAVGAIEFAVGGTLKIATGARDPSGKPRIDNVFLDRAELEALPTSGADSEINTDQDLVDRIGAHVEQLDAPPSKWVAALPANQCIVKHVRVPSTDDGEIAQIVAHQIGAIVPLDEDEFVFDYMVGRKGTDGYSELTLVIAQREVVDRIMDILRRAGISPAILTTGSIVLFNSYSLTSEEPTVVFVDLDGESAVVQVVRDGVLTHARSLKNGDVESPAGAGAIIGTPESSALLTELQRTLSTSIGGASDGDSQLRFVLSGSESAVGPIEQKLRDTFGAPVEVMRNGSSNGVDGTETRDETTLPEGCSTRILYSMLNGTTDGNINLLPREVVARRERRRLRKQFRWTAALGFALVAGLTFIVNVELRQKDRYLELLNAEIAKNREQASVLSSKRDKIELIYDHLDNTAAPLEVVTQLYQIVPANIKLNQLSYVDRVSVTLKGEASQMAHIFALSPILEHSELFSDVKILYASKNPRKANQCDFEISMTLM
jgi:hypothetical protein